MFLTELNFLFLVTLLSVLFIKKKNIDIYLFIFLNILLSINYSNFYLFNENYIFSVHYSDPLTNWLVGLSIFICFICFFWIYKSPNRLTLILVILITEICLINIFSTKNLLVFYIFFELSALPLLYLIIVKGPTFRKSVAFNYFLGYTLLGSAFFFIGLAILFVCFNSFNIEYIFIENLDSGLQTIVWFCFLITFSIKVPVLPFHLWLLEAHVEAPTLGSVILAALLLKIGGYGIIRFCLILFPEISLYWSPIVITIALVSTLYSTLSAFVQLDIKRIVAYSSIAHMNGSVVGVFSFNFHAFYGSILNMVAHGFTSAALFFLIGMLYKRFHTKNIGYYGGLASFMPIFHFFLLFFILSNIAFPGTFNFLSEILTLIGLNTWSSFVCLIFIISNTFLFIYCILLLTKVCYGEVNVALKELVDLNKNEIYLLVFLLVPIIVLGVKSQNLLQGFEHGSKLVFIKLG